MQLYKQTSYPNGAANAGCFSCGAPWQREQEFCLVTDIQLPRIGRVCFCDTCSTSIGRESGLVEPKKVKPSKELELTRQELTSAKDLILSIRETIEGSQVISVTPSE